jgi:PAS domain S-box-containing protein
MKKDEDKRHIPGNSPPGFFVHDEQGRFIDVNEQSCIDLGYSREELLSLTINDISRGANPEENAEKWRNAPAGLTMTFREIALRKNGSTYPVEINFTCQTLGERKIFVGLARQLGDDTFQPNTGDVRRVSLPDSLSSYRDRELLGRFSAFRATDLEQIRANMSRFFSATELDLPSTPLDLRVNMATLTDIDLMYVSTSADIIFNLPAIDQFCMQFSLRGSAATRIAGVIHDVNERHACIVPPRLPSCLKFDSGHHRLGLRISPETLKRKLGALTGESPNEDISFDPLLDMTQEQSQHLLYTSLFLAEALAWSSSTDIPSLVVRELEQAVVVAALVIDRDISRKLLQRPALLTAPHHVRVAEEYLSANWDRLVPIEELVAVSGVGMRTLFRSFNQHRGQSPMQFARLIRLRRAQELLSSPTPETTVLGTALACGYSNSGHFARQYFNAFGERPYQTLARHR